MIALNGWISFLANPQGLQGPDNDSFIHLNEIKPKIHSGNSSQKTGFLGKDF